MGRQNPETRLVRQIIKTLRADGGWWMKVHGSAFQVAGVPDIVGCYKGMFVSFEVKRPGFENTTNTRQEFIMDTIRRNGGIAEVVTSDLEALRVLYNKGVADAKEGK